MNKFINREEQMLKDTFIEFRQSSINIVAQLRMQLNPSLSFREQTKLIQRITQNRHARKHYESVIRKNWD